MEKRRLKWQVQNTVSQFSSVQSLSRVQLFETPCIASRQASLSITISRSSRRLTSIESVMPSSHLILGHPLLLLPPSRKHKSEQENVFACQSGTILMFDKIKSGELVGEEVHLIHSWNGYTLTWLF